ncbi:MAG: hypothetical protein JSW06_04000 [Thermoplasmatales archaeon]|nr:MAG: hypothetical protein JSW06_04000 [Thermoplasmatales archaeon]
MVRNNLIKKGVVVAVILLLIGLSCIPIGITSKVAPIDDIQKEPLGLFGLKGHLKFDFNLDDFLEPIKPFGIYFFPFNVSYKVSGMFADIIIHIIERWGYIWKVYSNNIVDLSIKDVPECAEIQFPYGSRLHFDISTEWERSKENPFISITFLDPMTPAFEISYYKIVGVSDSVKGRFGFLTWIHGLESEEEFPLVPDYLPVIDVTPEGNYIEIPQGQMVEKNITMESLANGLTLVKSEVIDIPSPDWWVYIQPETVLDIGEVKKVSLFIMPPENFTGREQIIISFTPYYYYNPELHGDPQSEYFTVEVQP